MVRQKTEGARDHPDFSCKQSGGTKNTSSRNWKTSSFHLGRHMLWDMRPRKDHITQMLSFCRKSVILQEAKSDVKPSFH